MKRLLSTALLSLVAAFAARAAELPQVLDSPTAATLPFSFVGQLFFASGGADFIGSGTVVRPSSILTAGHDLYDPDAGWSTDLLFRRGAYGDAVLSENHATRLFLSSGYRASAKAHGAEDIRTFANDFGGVRFGQPLASGGYAGWTTKSSLLTGPAYKVAVGYGAELTGHRGDFPLSVVPAAGFFSTYRGFFENSSLYFEGGMSGGPVFARDTDGKLYVAGVIVSGSTEPQLSGGVRILNPAAGSFIRKYLR